MNSTRLRNIARPALFLSSITIELLSFHGDILRDGNQGIATMLAVIGLFGLFAWKYWTDSISQSSPHRILFEYLSIASGLGLLWLLQTQSTFFSEGPSGADLFKLFGLGTSALLLIILTSLIRIALSHGSQLELQKTSRHSLGAWTTIGATAILLVVLNLQTRADVIVVGNKARITVERNGFPFPSVRRISAQHNPNSRMTDIESISFPNGATLERSPEKITTIRFRKRAEFPPAEQFRFRNGTSVTFANTSLAFILPNTEPIQFDLSTHKVIFRSKPQTYWSWLNAVLNLSIAIALLLHSNALGKRLFPSSA